MTAGARRAPAAVGVLSRLSIEALPVHPTATWPMLDQQGMEHPANPTAAP